MFAETADIDQTQTQPVTALAIARLVDPTVRESGGLPVQRWEVNVLRPHSGSAWRPKRLESSGPAVEVDVIADFDKSGSRGANQLEDAIERLGQGQLETDTEHAGWHRHGPVSTVTDYLAAHPDLEPVLPVAPAFVWEVHPIPEIVAPAWADPRPEPLPPSAWGAQLAALVDDYPECPYDSRCENGDLVLWWEHVVGEVPFFFKRRNAAFDVRLYREDIISRGVQIPGPLQISVGTPEETYYLAVDDDSIGRLASLLREAQLLARNLAGAAQ